MIFLTNLTGSLLIIYQRQRLPLKKGTLRKVTDLLNYKLTNGSKSIHFQQWYLLALEFIESKLHKQPYERLVRKLHNKILKIPFKNKGV